MTYGLTFGLLISGVCYATSQLTDSTITAAFVSSIFTAALVSIMDNLILLGVRREAAAAKKKRDTSHETRRNFTVIHK